MQPGQALPRVLIDGLALDDGLIAALREEVESQNVPVTIVDNSASPMAGAIGAALWSAFRHDKLVRIGQLPKAS